MANDPFDRLPKVPSFPVTSDTVKQGEPLPLAHMSPGSGVPGAKGSSPQLAWSGAPAGTKSFAVTMYDPDAPTQSGFWHWCVANIPADVASLPEGAGDATGSGLPKRAVQVRNDSGLVQFIGASPPKGHGPHRYFIAVHALDVEDLGIKPDIMPAFLGFKIFMHCIGRAVLQGTAETR